MDITNEIQKLLDSQPKPVCTDLTLFVLLLADNEPGHVKMEFAPQPAFENHFGHVQGGFAVAMLDVLISTVVYAEVRQWLPTVEIKTSFIAPINIGRILGEGSILRMGKRVIFVEDKLWNDTGELAVHGTATVIGLYKFARSQNE